LMLAACFMTFARVGRRSNELAAFPLAQGL
jgi:hypothetical protein